MPLTSSAPRDEVMRGWMWDWGRGMELNGGATKKKCTICTVFFLSCMQLTKIRGREMKTKNFSHWNSYVTSQKLSQPHVSYRGADKIRDEAMARAMHLFSIFATFPYVKTSSEFENEYSQFRSLVLNFNSKLNTRVDGFSVPKKDWERLVQSTNELVKIIKAVYKSKNMKLPELPSGRLDMVVSLMEKANSDMHFQKFIDWIDENYKNV